MLIQAIQAAGAGVVGAIRDAAAATGTSFQYLLATARVESGLNPQAAASSSSARGLFQFIDQTWLMTMKESGPSLGYGRQAEAITKLPSGRYDVADATLKRDILALRNDPTANAAMAGAYTQHNAEKLSENIGRSPSEGELYLAHFLGAGGAGRLITMASDKPGASAADAFPGAARANKSIFYDGQGNDRSVAQVYGLLVGRYDTARAVPKTPGTAGAAPTGPAPVRAASTASTAMTLVPAPPTTAASAAASPAAQVQAGFASLFSDPRSRPVSNVIQELWTSRPAVAAALTGQAASAVAPASQAGSPLDLFSDRASDSRRLFGAGS
jgi:hypothetical protein